MDEEKSFHSRISSRQPLSRRGHLSVWLVLLVFDGLLLAASLIGHSLGPAVVGPLFLAGWVVGGWASARRLVDLRLSRGWSVLLLVPVVNVVLVALLCFLRKGDLSDFPLGSGSTEPPDPDSVLRSEFSRFVPHEQRPAW